MFEKTGDRWEDKFEGLPGFGLVVAIVAMLLAWGLPRGAETAAAEMNALIAVAVAYLLYRSGSLLDKLFDCLYGSLEKAPPWPGGQALHNARRVAAKQLNCPLTGLYAKAEGILKKSEEWENEVEAKMDGSKAARSFIIPFLVILAVQLITRHSHLRLPHLLGLERLEPRIVEIILVAAVLVYLILDIKVVQWICLGAAPILLGILFLRLPREWLISWRFHPFTVGCGLLLTTLIYVWRRLAAMLRVYELASRLQVSKRFASVGNATSDEREMRGMLFAGNTVLPLRVVALYPSKEQGVTEDDLQRAERLVRSLALMNVQLYKFSERPLNAPLSGTEPSLPVSLLSVEEMKRIKGDYKPEESKSSREASLDVVIKVVKSPGSRSLLNKAELEKLLNGRHQARFGPGRAELGLDNPLRG
jgi:hypothetical protein